MIDGRAGSGKVLGVGRRESAAGSDYQLLAARQSGLKSVAMRSVLLRAGIVLLVLWLGFVTFIAWSMRQPPEAFGRVMARMPVAAYFVIPFETLWTRARAGRLQPGEAAPDFSLAKLDKSETVRLSSFQGKEPVVLVFGSYT